MNVDVWVAICSDAGSIPADSILITMRTILKKPRFLILENLGFLLFKIFRYLQKRYWDQPYFPNILTNILELKNV